MSVWERLKAIINHLEKDGSFACPQIMPHESFDLSSFSEQESDVEGFDVEFVDQHCIADTGDSFYGHVAWVIGDMVVVASFYC